MDIDQLIVLTKAEVVEYEKDPTLFMLKQAINDLKQIDKYDNINLYQIDSTLSTLINTIPAFLQSNDININEKLLHFINDVSAFCKKIDQHYVYVDYLDTSSGYSCCQKLSVYFTTNLQLLLLYIPKSQLLILVNYIVINYYIYIFTALAYSLCK